jgi:pyruvate/2-oxoglutarate dehydrogenase complex dihydrolipoamide acyltransferase (E2) component
MAKIKLKLPKLAVSMQDGTITEWLVASGDSVSVGQHIYTVESEKTSMEVESPFAGTITVLAASDETLPVGTVIAEIES